MKYKICLLIAVMAFQGFAGCAGIKNSMRPSGKNSQWNLLSKLNDSKNKKSEESQPPQTMAAIWKDSVFEKPGTASVRGFGARIFFYDENNQAVKADGEMIVYGFDDSNELKEDNSKADRKYVFQADKFQTHFSETDLGPSYSVWVPWEKVGGFRKTITLIPVFKTADGRILKSGQSINVLPGRNPVKQTAKTKRGLNTRSNSSVSQAGFVTTAFDSANDEPGDGNRQAAHEVEEVYNRIRTSTIKLTPNLASRLAQPTLKTAAKIPTPVSKTSSDNGRAGEATASRDATDNKSSLAAKPQESSAPAPTKSSRLTAPRVFGSPGSFR